MGALRTWYDRQRFAPGAMGWWVNPFYFARRGLAREMRDLLGGLRGRVLDVGCGRKPYREWLSATTYVGVDIDSEVTRALGCADLFYDGRRLPAADGSFDAVLCSQVLEHVFEPEPFLREIGRVLVPGGHLLLATPFMWDEHEQPHDFGRYSSFGLRALLERNGFEVVVQRKATVGFIAIVQLASGHLYKLTRTRVKTMNLAAQLFLIAPANAIGAILAMIVPRQEDIYLDNVVLVRKRG